MRYHIDQFALMSLYCRFTTAILFDMVCRFDLTSQVSNLCLKSLRGLNVDYVSINSNTSADFAYRRALHVYIHIMHVVYAHTCLFEHLVS